MPSGDCAGTGPRLCSSVIGGIYMRRLLPCLVLAVMLGMPLPGGATGHVGKGANDLALRGDAACTRCHDEDEAYPVLAIGKTRHGTVADGRTPTCTSCHGTSERHNRRDDVTGDRPKPDILFGKSSPNTPQERDRACLSCHQGGNRIHWQGNLHAARDVSCTSCHQVHTQHDRVTDKTTQTAVCTECHTQQRAQILRPFRHPVQEGKVACSDCHQPHGSAGPKMMVRDTVNDTCFQCHMEKRGPFLWNHQPVTEDCSICHNPHGTTVAGLLKFRPPFLCQQCHEGTSHRGTAPGTTPATNQAHRGTGLTMARGCVNCHTNIHGGNNPADDARARSLRR
jgi:DmsE family decaheme c-type cytochrome